MGNDFVVIFELYAERRIGQEFRHGAGEFQKFFFRHLDP
jgi:hypothetical protein